MERQIGPPRWVLNLYFDGDKLLGMDLKLVMLGTWGGDGYERRVWRDFLVRCWQLHIERTGYIVVLGLTDSSGSLMATIWSTTVGGTNSPLNRFQKTFPHSVPYALAYSKGPLYLLPGLLPGCFTWHRLLLAQNKWQSQSGKGVAKIKMERLRRKLSEPERK